MTDKKLSDLTAGTVSDTTLFYCTNSPGVSQNKITGLQIKNYAASGGSGTVTTTGSPSSGQMTKFSGATSVTNAVAGTDYSAGTSALATGIVKSTTTTGALTIAVAGDFPTLNQNTTGSAATLTTTRTFAIAGSTGLTATAQNFNGSANVSLPLAGTLAIANGGTNATTIAAARTNLGVDALQYSFTFGDGTTAIVAGSGYDAWVRIKENITLTGVELTADQSGSAVVDVWVDTYANFPPTVADTITAAAKPTLSTAIKYQDTTLTGWTKNLAKGSYIKVHIDSASTVTRLVLSLYGTNNQ